MSLGSQVICVHNDECYLTTKSGIRYDKKLDKKGIREFTKLIVNLKNILANLENYSAYDYVEACKSVALFITKYNHQKY